METGRRSITLPRRSLVRLGSLLTDIWKHFSCKMLKAKERWDTLRSAGFFSSFFTSDAMEKGLLGSPLLPLGQMTF